MEDRAEIELDTENIYAVIKEEKYKPELELYDRWRAFSEEVLRLSLLGIAAFGFFYQQAITGFDQTKHPEAKIFWIKLFSLSSLTLFAIAAVGALIYRYGSTEAIMHYVWGLRKNKESNLSKRTRWLNLSFLFKTVSAICMMLGAIFAAITVFYLLYHKA